MLPNWRRPTRFHLLSANSVVRAGWTADGLRHDAAVSVALPPVIEPGRDLARVEPEEVAPLHERDPPLRHEPADVPDGHAEVLGDALNIKEVR